MKPIQQVDNLRGAGLGALPKSAKAARTRQHHSSLVRVLNPHGLHLRAASDIVKLAQTYDAAITLEHAGASANARSVLSLACLAASYGSVVKVTAVGTDAQPAVQALAQLFANGFAECPQPILNPSPFLAPSG